ncbi:unnamed protein product [Caenorhabditis bovis]|uniref:Cystatin domain-containing protein n=1 Tax=Caenorhabditis bovis TaxID=2654633 RepID=A0A8S1E4U9_9PELO|nr:unnamed protein product [Caenorhabditis bovis]
MQIPLVLAIGFVLVAAQPAPPTQPSTSQPPITDTLIILSTDSTANSSSNSVSSTTTPSATSTDGSSATTTKNIRDIIGIINKVLDSKPGEMMDYFTDDAIFSSCDQTYVARFVKLVQITERKYSSEAYFDTVVYNGTRYRFALVPSKKNSSGYAFDFVRELDCPDEKASY